MTKQETLLGRGTRVESSRVREPRRTAVPRDCRGFMLPDCLWPIILSQGFLVTHVSLGQDGFQAGFWEVAGHPVPPLTFLELFRLVMACQFHVPSQALVSESDSGRQLLWYLRRVVPASWAASVFPRKTPRSTEVVTVITMCNSPVKVHSTQAPEASEPFPHCICLISWKSSIASSSFLGSSTNTPLSTLALRLPRKQSYSLESLW